MKIVLLIFSGLLSLSIFNLSSFRLTEDPKAIVKKADEKMRGKTSTAEVTIQIVRVSWTREIKMKTWSKGNNFALILVTSPAKEKGTVYLKRDKEVWNWIPSIERNIKLPPSMMGQSWMGTDFTNDDLVKESSIVEDYNHVLTGDSSVNGKDCYKIQLMPKPEAAVVWSKILVWIDKKDYIQMRAEFYDEENKPVSTMQSSDIRMMGGRLLPSRVEMIPGDKKGQKTVMIYDKIQFDQPLEDVFFSPENMKKVK